MCVCVCVCVLLGFVGEGLCFGVVVFFALSFGPDSGT